MRPLDENDTLRSILKSTFAAAPSSLAATAKSLAAEGNISALRLILEGGLVDNKLLPADGTTSLAVLPVLYAQATEPSKEARELVADWHLHFGKPTEAQISRALACSKDPILVDALIRNGACPAGSDGWAHSPLFTVVKEGDVAVAEAMLRLCVERDVVPSFGGGTPPHTLSSGVIEALQGHSRDPSVHAMMEALLSVMEEGALGPNVQGYLRADLLHFRHKHEFTPRATAKLISTSRTLRLACLAGFDRNEWLEFLDNCVDPGGVICPLTDMRDVSDTSEMVIRRMHAAGVNLEVVTADFTDEKLGALNLLQRAAKADNPAIAGLLLELGCDPDAAVSYKGKMCTAKTLAYRNGRVATIFAAHNARESMLKTVSNSLR